MNAYNTAQELITYYAANRAVGHTTTMLNGAKNTKCIVVGHTLKFTKYLKGNNDNITGISMNGLGDIRGRNLPLVVDHVAIQLLLGELIGQIAALRKDKEELTNKIAAIKSILQS